MLAGRGLSIMVSLHLCMCLYIWYQKSRKKQTSVHFTLMQFKPCFPKTATAYIIHLLLPTFLIWSNLTVIIYHCERFQVLKRVNAGCIQVRCYIVFFLWFILQCSHYLRLPAAFVLMYVCPRIVV